MKIAFIFPGQGSQSVGMGKSFFDYSSVAREVFEEADSTLNEKLSKIIFDGPLDILSMTHNTQPALMTTSIAILKVIEKEFGLATDKLCSYVAGHSLGEYSAACASKVFSFNDTVELVRLRGKSMQEAVPLGKGAMAAILGTDYEELQNILNHANKFGLCQVANDNAPGQIVISGETKAIDEAIIFTQSINKKAIKLPVSAPFHSSLMEPVSKIMNEAFAKINVSEPIVPLISNVNAEPVTDSNQIISNLVLQVSGNVRWKESIEKLVKLGVNNFVEIGAGKVLAGLNKRIDRSINTIVVNEPSNMDELANLINN